MTATNPAPGGDDNKGLYLDLLVKCIANTIYEDPRQTPGAGANKADTRPVLKRIADTISGRPPQGGTKPAPTYSDELRSEGRDWPSVAHSMIGLKRLNNLRELCETAMREAIPGDFIETGVWRGGACILMRGILAAYQDKTRRVIVADSFAGLPEAKPDDYPADEGDIHHTFKELAIPLETVRENFSRYGLLDNQVEFLKGWFCDTLPTLGDRRFALIRLDGDMYQSTMEGLENLYDRVSPGGFIIIDDYGAIPACRQAVEDFRTRRGIDEPLTKVDWTGVWWRKPR